MAERPEHDPATIRAALACVSPECDRDTWVRVLAAVKSWNGAGARDLAEEWSAMGQTYRAADFQATWKSLQTKGAITVGTLLALAKKGGFELKRTKVEQPQTASSDGRIPARAARDREEDARRARKRDEAASEAQRRFGAASDAGTSEYLARKRVAAHGVRFDSENVLLVPMYDAAGTLRSLQTIAPNGVKKFLAGGQAMDLLHWIGDPTGATHIAIAEGYATAATIHESTGIPIAVAYTAGNVPNVARIVRHGFPLALLVICADDDHETAERSNKNPGMNAAREAARVGRAVVAIPAPLLAGETDFNDLACRLGRDAVSAIVQAAMAKCTSKATDTDPIAKASATEAAGDDPFQITERGVCYRSNDRDGRATLQWVCGALGVEARTRDGDGASWGYLLAFDDPEGTPKRMAIPGRLFAGDGAELRSRLLDEGLAIAVGPARIRLPQYIATRRPPALVRVAETIGWHGDGFVLPHRSFGESASELFYQSGDERSRNPFRERGSLDAWRTNVARLCEGNPRLLFAVAIAFAGPCLHLLDLLSGGFHFFGASSKGKTTALAIGASVWGKPELGGFMRTWRATGNALEAVAAAHSDTTLFLDELREVEPREIVQTVLMLGNGAGKQRMRAGGTLRAALAWRLLFMSTGERRVEELAAAAGVPVDAGAGVRLVEIPVPDSGVFANFHDAGDGARFAEAVRASALESYGTAGPAWLEYLTTHRTEATAYLRKRTNSVLENWLERATDAGQVSRVAARFALVGIAGELATRAGITGWLAGESERAAKCLFDDWLSARGTRGDAEALSAVRQVAALLGQHAESYFPWWHRATDDHRPNSPRVWGLRKQIGPENFPIETLQQRDTVIEDGHSRSLSAEFHVLASAFRDEICRGFDPRYVARVLCQRGYLVPESERRLDRKERLPSIGPARCYVVNSSIFEDEAL